MKQTCELPATPLLNVRIPWPAREQTNSMPGWVALLKKVVHRLPDRAHLAKTTAAALLVSCLFLAGSCLFLVQLAEYGW